MKSFFMNLNKLAAALCLVATCAVVAPLALSQQAEESAAPAVANPFDIITKPSGLKIRELVTGTGATAYLGQTVAVHYTGWVQNPDGSRGSKFDSSRDRGQPLEFAIGHGDVVKGWDEGVQGMKVGGKRRLIVPPALGYGAKGTPSGSIPPFATLIFDVELVSVK